MNNSEYRQFLLNLKEKSIKDSEKNFNKYKKKLFFFWLLWYFFIYFIAFLFLILLLGILYIVFKAHHWLVLLLHFKILILLVIPFYVLLKTIFIKFPEPKWYEIKKEDYNLFFENLEKITKELWIKIHKIIIIDEVDAFVDMHPRLWIFWWNKNILGIWLPLIIWLSKEELKAVILHEFWHISHNHWKISNWIYKTKIRFNEFLNIFREKDFIGSKIILKFFDWYIPRFTIYGYSLIRKQEFEADKIAVKYSSIDIFSNSLIKINIIDFIFKKYYEDVYKKMMTLPKPIKNFYNWFIDYLKNYNLDLEDKKIIEKNIKENNIFDTHPTTEERLKIFWKKIIFKKIEIKQFDWKIIKLINDFDLQWYNDIENYWEDTYYYKQKELEEINKFKQKNINELNNEELKNFIFLLKDNTELNIDVFPYIKELYDRDPQNPENIFLYWEELLNKWDNNWVDYLLKLKEYKDYFYHACSIAIQYFEKIWDKNNEKKWIKYLDEYFDKDEEFEKERSSFSKNDKIIDFNEKDKEILEKIKKFIKESEVWKDIKNIWVVKKDVKYYPEKPLYIFLVKIKTFTLNKDLEYVINFLAQNMFNSIEEEDIDVIFYWDDWNFFNFTNKKIRKNWIKLI